jgi:hypothetical protein
MSDILNAIIGAGGLRLEFLHEHEEIHWRHLPAMRQDPDGLYRFPPEIRKLPVMFSLKASRD